MDPELFINAFVSFTETVDSDGKTFNGTPVLQVCFGDGWLHILDEDPQGNQAVYSVPSRSVAWVRSTPDQAGSPREVLERMRAGGFPLHGR